MTCCAFETSPEDAVTDLWEFAEKNLAAVVGSAGAIATGIGGAVAFFAGRRASSRASDAEAQRLQLEGWKTLAQNYRDTIGQLETRVDDCEADRSKLWAEIHAIRRDQRSS